MPKKRNAEVVSGFTFKQQEKSIYTHICKSKCDSMLTITESRMEGMYISTSLSFNVSSYTKIFKIKIEE